MYTTGKIIVAIYNDLAKKRSVDNAAPVKQMSNGYFPHTVAV